MCYFYAGSSAHMPLVLSPSAGFMHTSLDIHTCWPEVLTLAAIANAHLTLAVSRAQRLK